jgi:transposase-like protein
MTKQLECDAIYLNRHFDVEIIVLRVRWYITYKLSYRDLAAMMAERAVVVSPTIIMRWVNSLRARIREALEWVLAIRRLLVAGRRYLHRNQGQG